MRLFGGLCEHVFAKTVDGVMQSKNGWGIRQCRILDSPTVGMDVNQIVLSAVGAALDFAKHRLFIEVYDRFILSAQVRLELSIGFQRGHTEVHQVCIEGRATGPEVVNVMAAGKPIESSNR